MSYIDPVHHRLGEWGARPPRTGGAVVVFGDALEDFNRCKLNPADPVCKAFSGGAAPAADPWAKQGEGTFTASTSPAAATAAVLMAPVNALASLFSAFKTPAPLPANYAKTGKPKSNLMPIAIAGAAAVGLLLFLKRRK